MLAKKYLDLVENERHQSVRIKLILKQTTESLLTAKQGLIWNISFWCSENIGSTNPNWDSFPKELVLERLCMHNVIECDVESEFWNCEKAKNGLKMKCNRFLVRAATKKSRYNALNFTWLDEIVNIFWGAKQDRYLRNWRVTYSCIVLYGCWRMKAFKSMAKTIGCHSLDRKIHMSSILMRKPNADLE